jgi:putative ABC transport system permease protein
VSARATVHLAVAGLRRRGLGQTLVLALVAALASAAIVAGLAAQTSSAEVVDAAYERANRPDLVLYGPLDELRAVAGDAAVAEASEPRALSNIGTTDVDGDPIEVLLSAVDPDDLPAVGRPDLVSGRWPGAGAREIVVEQSLVAEGVTAVGDSFTVDRPGGTTVTFEVVGSAVDLTDCFWPTCDPLRVFALPAAVAELGSGDGGEQRYVAAYRLVDPAEAVAMHTRLVGDADQQLGGSAWPDTRGDILVIGSVFGALLGGFGLFLLATACLVVAGATAARLVARRRTLGLLKAVGFTPSQLTASVLGEHAVIGAAGVVAGWVLGSLLSPAVQAGIDGVVGEPSSMFGVRPLLVALALVEAFLAVSVVVPSWRAGRQPASAVLRDAPPSPDGGRRVAAVAGYLGAGPALVSGIRRAFARPVRAGLAAAGVVVAATGSIVAAGFLQSIDRLLDDPAALGEPWEAALSNNGLPATTVEEGLSSRPEVRSWYTELDATGTVGDAVFGVRILGGDPDAAGFNIEEGRSLRSATEAIAGYGFLEATGREVGEQLSIDVDGRPLELTIVGWYHEFEDSGEVVRVREEAAAGLSSGSPTWHLRAAAGTTPEQLAAAVADRFGDDVIVETYGVNDGGLAAINGSLVAMAAILGLVAFANLLAMTLSTTRERARSLGVLRTIGTTTGQLVGQSAAGAGVIGLIAGFVGVPLGTWVFRTLSDSITSGVGVGPGLTVTPSRAFLVAVMLACTVVAAAAGGLAAAGLARRPAAELVRYE